MSDTEHVRGVRLFLHRVDMIVDGALMDRLLDLARRLQAVASPTSTMQDHDGLRLTLRLLDLLVHSCHEGAWLTGVYPEGSFNTLGTMGLVGARQLAHELLPLFQGRLDRAPRSKHRDRTPSMTV